MKTKGKLMIDMGWKALKKEEVEVVEWIYLRVCLEWVIVEVDRISSKERLRAC